MKKNLDVIVLAVYTFINLKILMPFVFDSSDLRRLALSENISFFTLIIGLFLNTFLILYWFKNRNK